MELIEQQKIILQDYKERKEKLLLHKNIWQEKVDELAKEINMANIIIDIAERFIKEAESKDSK